jgi:Gas vesicle synthesis protein GvpL/GvpF
MSSAAGEAALYRNGSGWYLYGVVAAEEAVTGLASQVAVDPEHEVVLIAEGPLAGVTSKVSLQEFDEAILPERLGDTAWLEHKIRAHEQVLERVLAEVTVVPCRFCTVYRSEEELRRFLVERKDALAAALEYVRGQVEVGVKAFLDSERFGENQAAQNDAVRELGAQASPEGGGRAYLERRRVEQLVAAERERFKSESAREIHARLLGAARAGVPLPLQAPEMSNRADEMLFNGAYLVAAQQRLFKDVLESLVRDYGESGAQFELTGPWPPYNFVPAELGAS